VTRKLNCWEFKNCGREKGGLMVEVLGECPVVTAMHLDGTNGGQAGGRSCWTVRGCGNRLARAGIGTLNGCQKCEFFRRVAHEEETTISAQLSSSEVA
jgi:hypothetical protein